MKGRARKGTFICLMAGFMLGVLAASSMAETAEVQAPRKIVVFKDHFVNRASQTALLRGHGATVRKGLGLINAMAVHLPPQAEKAVSLRPEVLRIDDDIVINADGKAQPSEVLPWGVDRIEADIAQRTTKGLAVKVAILDTGIDLDHPDLRGNIKGNVNLINPLRSGDDDNGHGTHVAGIVAAIDNEIGVIGTGPEIHLYAVKVLDRRGSGWLSDLIEGLEWSVNNKMQIVNMSLGSASDNQSYHDAIRRVYQAGVIQVASAGNNGGAGGAITYPAKYDVETIAVSAVDSNNSFASFSSYGPEVDLAAPGVNISSTYKGGYYKTLSGTSMAAPHVAGTAALTLSVKGSMLPDQMKLHLRNTSENLGLPSYQQGAGLVRADTAIQ